MPHHHRWPRAIVHVDGDGFFAACEQAVNPALKGKPVVTGKERNIVAAASYEAKALGISRGVALWEAKKMCPELIVLPSDYETYSLFSKRLFDIMRRYTPAVEEYSIDEGFADISGTRRVHHCSYEAIARTMQQTIHSELGITVSVGVSTTKTLAKTGSRHRKPAGLTIIEPSNRVALLGTVAIERVWNIGPNTAALLRHYGIVTAADFAQRPAEFVERVLNKCGYEVWRELNGEIALALTTAAQASYQSISKTKTFTPPSREAAFVYAQLIRNLEAACAKARRYHQAPRGVVIGLRRQDFHYDWAEIHLVRPSAFPLELLSAVQQLFAQTFMKNTLYRATIVVLRDLVAAAPTQASLFEGAGAITQLRKLYTAVDTIQKKYGKYSVHHASSVLEHHVQHLSARGDVPERKARLLPGETKRRRLPLPLLQVSV